ncbi:tetratricopeptide repeat protein [Deinococcus sp.]|uniref:tetratricopeptide repeat protein n=1 Tax=Deinococcus sp. TaxID=47478 RepID=UPI0025DB50CA|nr:tetratricopeptide repeat protein [Deinococcus sp.]
MGLRSRQPSASSWTLWASSIRALTELGKFAEARRTAKQALVQGHRASALLELLGGAVAASSEDWHEEREGLRLRLRLLGNAGQEPQIEALTRAELAGEQHQGDACAAFLHAYLAFALVQREAYREALGCAEQALLHLTALYPHERVLVRRMQAIALNRLDPDSDWAGPLEDALAEAQGWVRSLLLTDLAGLHSRRGNEAAAMLAFAEALPLVGQPADRAELLSNMGLICLRAGQLAEAEEYFGQAVKINSSARSRALSGQAAARRALGEWARASALYEQASRVAAVSGDDDDLRQALRGLGHTQRLAGQHMTALATLRRAAQVTQADRTSGVSWVNVDLAAALVSLPSLDAAQVRHHLERSGPLDREEAERASIVRAELWRREGQADQARCVIELLGPHVLWVREEAHAFALLFGLLDAERRPVPLPRAGQTEVALRVLGLPEVRVNGRRIDLPPLELVMLTALVEAGGELSTDELTEVLRDDRPRTPRLATQRVSRVAGQLAAALGWPGSLRALRGHYLLDPATHWTTDSLGVQRGGRPPEAYLSGVHLPWAISREQELRQRD